MSIHTDPAKTFVVIPAYNENAVITSVINDVLAFNYSLIVVDDGSKSSLFPLLKNKTIYFLRHAVNMGQGAALQTGIEFALSKKADYIVTFDADGQHGAADISKLLEKLISAEADIALGSRFMKGAYHNMPVMRKMLIHIARMLNFFLTGLFLTDAHNGLRAMNRKAAESLIITENGMAHASELLSLIKRNKLRYAEVPVSIHYTPYSRKKGQTAWSGFRIFFDLLLNKIFK